MTDSPDAAGGDVERVVPVRSTGSGTSAASEVAELVEASGSFVAAKEAGPVGAPGTSASSDVAESVEASGSLATTKEAEPVEASGTATAPPARQPVVRVRGSRRARLLPAPGTTAEPAPADDRERGQGSKPVASGPNDDRMLGDVPPHY